LKSLAEETKVFTKLLQLLKHGSIMYYFIDSWKNKKSLIKLDLID
jgi:hypothetical protein